MKSHENNYQSIQVVRLPLVQGSLLTDVSVMAKAYLTLQL